MTHPFPVEPAPWPEDPPDHAELVALDRERSYRRRVDSELERIRAQHEARALFAAEKAADSDFTDQFLTRSQLRTLPAPDPLIDKVLPRHAYAILRGRDHSYKSFVAIDWACSLATGKTWQGHTTVPVRVLYIAGEGAHGLRQRVDAWEAAWGRQVPDDQFTVRRSAPNLHTPGPAFDNLLEHVETGRYGLVIVDTLRRVSGSADANSSDMGTVIDNLDRIKRATHDGTVLAVAHTDKGDHDTRGYSGIEDDADVVWAAKRDEDQLELTLTKMKDGPDGASLHLQVQRSGSSLILAESSGPAMVSNKHQLAILDTLTHTYRDGATPNDLLGAIDITKATLYRALASLEDAGHIQNTGTRKRKYYELPPPEMDPLNQEESHDD